MFLDDIYYKLKNYKKLCKKDEIVDTTNNIINNTNIDCHTHINNKSLKILNINENLKDEENNVISFGNFEGDNEIIQQSSTSNIDSRYILNNIPTNEDISVSIVSLDSHSSEQTNEIVINNKKTKNIIC